MTDKNLKRFDKTLKQFDKALSKLEPYQLDYAVKKIQAVEGGKDLVNLENLLFSMTQPAIAGMENEYKGYAAQVIETYLKYNGLRDLGCWNTQAVINYRTAFIVGEGLSATSPNDKTSEWLDKFLSKNKLKGSLMNRAVKGSEITGKILFVLIYDKNEKRVKVLRIPYGNLVNEMGEKVKNGINYEVVLSNEYDLSSIKNIVKVDGESKIVLGYKNFIYIITGGDDSSVNEPITKVGSVLTELENYDRALKELRRSNYVTNRITPDFECKDKSEATQTAEMISKTKWSVGKARVGTAKFDYKSPNTNTVENTEKELQANAKAVATTTGVLVHWMGHVELMSNRATAQTLYEQIDKATVLERTAIEEGIYDLIIKAQELEINSGSSELSEIDYDIEVKLPLISFHQFKDNIQALSNAYADKAISLDDYRNFIPGIDPYKTKKSIEQEEKQNKEDFRTPLNNEDLNKELDDEIQALNKK